MFCLDYKVAADDDDDELKIEDEENCSSNE
jgi:hypothetical protein